MIATLHLSPDWLPFFPRPPGPNRQRCLLTTPTWESLDPPPALSGTLSGGGEGTFDPRFCFFESDLRRSIFIFPAEQASDDKVRFCGIPRFSHLRSEWTPAPRRECLSQLSVLGYFVFCFFVCVCVLFQAFHGVCSSDFPGFDESMWSTWTHVEV